MPERYLLPLFILLILIILVSFTDFTTRISVYVGAILAAVFEHVRVSNALPGIGYTTALDYIFYSCYLPQGYRHTYDVVN